MTEIREEHFSMDLPGEWEPAESSETGTTVYREKEGDAVVSVTLLAVKPSFAIADRRMLLEQYLHHRSKFEKAQRPWLGQSPYYVEEREGAVEGGWAGEDPGTRHLLLHRVTIGSGLLADVAFEASGIDAAAFDERAAAVLGTVSLPGE